MNKLYELAISLARAETENEIINILQKNNYWDNPKHWEYFGGIENNYSTIGNQQSAADAALVEKLVNSIDAVLTRKCLQEGINPEDAQNAPKSMKEALIKFFGIREGDIANLDAKKRNEMSKEIILAATGAKRNPNLVIIDMGEGQTPAKMPTTILSIGKSNKLKIPFVQGKFNMGGTGVFCFCSPDYNVQVIITKRCPDILDKCDISSKKWGVTVVRREAANEGKKSSTYTYLTDAKGNVLDFEADVLPVIPSAKGEYEELPFGMFIKLINYDISPYKTNILLDLNYRLALLMPKMAYPIRLVESRDYKGHTLEATLSGLDVRLKDDRSENIEDGYPDSFQINSLSEKFSGSIFVFKEGANIENYKKSEGVIFTVNGQTHASLSKAFFKRRNNEMGLAYIADSLLVILDCSKLSTKQRENLFMNSRDRLRDCELKKAIENDLFIYLKNHEGLSKLQHERRKKALSKRLQDEKPLADVLEKILKKAPTLARLFSTGDALKFPYNTKETGSSEKYVGKKHPTFLKLRRKAREGQPDKSVPVNHDYRIQLETDAENDYFYRESEPGDLVIYCNNDRCDNLKKSLGLFNGVVTLTLSFPEGTKSGDTLNFQVNIIDDCITYALTETFTVYAANHQDYNSGGNGGKRTPASGTNSKEKRKEPDALAMPITTSFYKDEWDHYKANQDTALVAKGTEKNVYDFFINMDNICLLNEIKNIKGEDKINLMKAQYKYSNVLIGISVINHYMKLEEANGSGNSDEIDVEEKIKEFSKIISPVILPMINVLGELEESEFSSLIDED